MLEKLRHALAEGAKHSLTSLRKTLEEDLKAKEEALQAQSARVRQQAEDELRVEITSQFDARMKAFREERDVGLQKELEALHIQEDHHQAHALSKETEKWAREKDKIIQDQVPVSHVFLPCICMHAP